MTFVSPSSFTRDPDGFAPPTFGGALAIKHATIRYTDTTSKVLFTLPAGAVVVDFGVLVWTAFNDTGTDLLNVGTEDPDTYVDDHDVSTTTVTRAGGAATLPFDYLFAAPLSEETPVYGKYTGQNGNASAGEAEFYLYYMLKA